MVTPPHILLLIGSASLGGSLYPVTLLTCCQVNLIGCEMFLVEHLLDTIWYFVSVLLGLNVFIYIQIVYSCTDVERLRALVPFLHSAAGLHIAPHVGSTTSGHDSSSNGTPLPCLPFSLRLSLSRCS